MKVTFSYLTHLRNRGRPDGTFLRPTDELNKSGFIEENSRLIRNNPIDTKDVLVTCKDQTPPLPPTNWTSEGNPSPSQRDNLQGWLLLRKKLYLVVRRIPYGRSRRVLDVVTQTIPRGRGSYQIRILPRVIYKQLTYQLQVRKVRVITHQVDIEQSFRR